MYEYQYDLPAWFDVLVCIPPMLMMTMVAWVLAKWWVHRKEA